MVDPSYLHWLCSVPIGASVATLGLIGNCLAMIVWNQVNKSRPHGNQSTVQFFIMLSICDSGLLLSFLVQDTLPTNHPELMENYHYTSAYAWFLFPMFFFWFVCAIWMLVGITVNRFIMITFPMKANMIFTRWKTKIYMFGILLFAFCVNLPHFFTYRVGKKDDTNKYQLEFTEFGSSDDSERYEFWAHCMVLVLGPWFTIAILNTAIILRIKSKAKQFMDVNIPNKKQKYRQVKMTKMLLTVTFTFLLLLIWQCVTQCLWMQKYGKNRDDGSTWNSVDSSFAVAKLGAIISASINWFLYCITSSMFRKRMTLMVGVHIRRMKSALRSDLPSTTTTSAQNSKARIP